MEQPFDASIVRNKLGQLSSESHLAFLLSCAERLVPNYVAFAEHHDWGNVIVLRRALQLGWKHLLSKGTAIGEAKELLETCEAAAPDTEHFDSVLVSPALDAANCCLLVLEMLLEHNIEKAVEGAVLAHDTVDMYIREIESLHPQRPDTSARVNRHPLMQQELRRQRQDLEFLAQTRLSREAVNQLASRWQNPRTSSIGLSSRSK